MRYKQEPGNPGECCGKRGDHDEGIEPGLKVDYDQQVYKHDRERQSAQKADVGGSHRLNLTTDNNSRTARQLLACGINDLVNVGGDGTQVASRESSKDGNHRRYVVM